MLRRAVKILLCLASACGSDSAPAPDGSTDADSGVPSDSAVPDAATEDGGAQEDAGSQPDAGQPGCTAFELPADCTSTIGPLPDELRCTGLYGDWEAREPACGVREYKPAYELWSDGAVKRRFVQLPPGGTVDVSDPDGFVFPVGTQLWKEFSVQVDGTLQRAETRLLRKVEAGWLFTTYVWDAQQGAARQVNDGVADWNGSGHTIPTREQCAQCHEGRADRVLGWDFLLLGQGATGLTGELLASEGLLSPATLPGNALAIPGDEVERAALGYLHVNCGVSCHNDSSLAEARDSGLFMRLDADTLESVFTTPTATSAINVRPAWGREIGSLPAPEVGFFRIRPLDLEATLLLARMGVRGGEAQMPPLGTNLVDEQGVALIEAWVEHMTEARGYPAPDATSGASVAAP